jgi:hypothetical protein
MNPVRSAKAYYFAAFFFGAIIALLVVAPARGAGACSGFEVRSEALQPAGEISDHAVGLNAVPAS